MLREPYITVEGLRGMKGMADHLGDDLESYKARQGSRPRKPDSRVYHKLDEAGEQMGGMDGEIVEGLLHFCMSELGTNPAVTKAFKEMLMVARLSAGEDFMKPYTDARDVRTARRRQVETEYEQRLKTWEKSMERTIEHYHETEAELKSRWERVIKSLRAAVKKNPDITTMALGDQDVFNYLNRKGYVVIRKNIITDVTGRLDTASLGCIREICTKMNSIAVERKASRAVDGMLSAVALKKPKGRITPPAVA